PLQKGEGIGFVLYRIEGRLPERAGDFERTEVVEQAPQAVKSVFVQTTGIEFLPFPQLHTNFGLKNFHRR
ncbi:MAG: hypothetical protein GWN87_05715, partial [Desulfuromonadales bacterium]|nr:hypothetical protein [Desulfuromonadales bacterium]NIS40076.1 hypothetical protein [Desulfuromonadales bacterium]